MTVVSSKEFADNTDKYLDLAVNEDIFIERDGKMFVITNNEQFLEPDEDFYNALSADEFRERLIDVVEKIDKKYAQNASHCPAESTWVF